MYGRGQQSWQERIKDFEAAAERSGLVKRESESSNVSG